MGQDFAEGEPIVRQRLVVLIEISAQFGQAPLDRGLGLWEALAFIHKIHRILSTVLFDRLNDEGHYGSVAAEGTREVMEGGNSSGKGPNEEWHVGFLFWRAAS